MIAIAGEDKHPQMQPLGADRLLPRMPIYWRCWGTVGGFGC
ncbi:hypothetical protein [Aliamphritea spongicola]|nr:hypothetical protein [Aliamphritea spongicola]